MFVYNHIPEELDSFVTRYAMLTSEKIEMNSSFSSLARPDTNSCMVRLLRIQAITSSNCLF